MSVKLRLQVHGKKDAKCYKIVVATSKSPRDGKFIEKIGYYNPTHPKNKGEIKKERVSYWFSVGAKATETVQKLLKKFNIEGFTNLYKVPEKTKYHGISKKEIAERKKKEIAELKEKKKQKEEAKKAQIAATQKENNTTSEDVKS